MIPFNIRQAHEASLNGWVQLILNLICHEYFIINGKTLVTQFIRKGVKCFRFNTMRPVLLIADLLTERVTPAPRFKLRIRLGRPFKIKNKSQKTEKIYIAMFVCISIKAVHMKLVSKLKIRIFYLCIDTVYLEEASNATKDL